MPWQYSQRTGRLTHDGEFVGKGYSGKGLYKDNPTYEHLRNLGPIPRGRWRIGSSHSHPTKGSTTMALTPVGHTAFGRSHFLIHGDSMAHPGQASEGCIVLGPAFRRRIATSGDNELVVVP